MGDATRSDATARSSGNEPGRTFINGMRTVEQVTPVDVTVPEDMLRQFPVVLRICEREPNKFQSSASDTNTPRKHNRTRVAR